MRNGFYPPKVLVTGKMGIGTWEWSVHRARGSGLCIECVEMVCAMFATEMFAPSHQAKKDFSTGEGQSRAHFS